MLCEQSDRDDQIIINICFTPAAVTLELENWNLI